TEAMRKQQRDLYNDLEKRLGALQGAPPPALPPNAVNPPQSGPGNFSGGTAVPPAGGANGAVSAAGGAVGNGAPQGSAAGQVGATGSVGDAGSGTQPTPGCM